MTLRILPSDLTTTGRLLADVSDDIVRRVVMEKRPRGSAWIEIETPETLILRLNPIAMSTWVRPGFRIISGLELAEAPHGKDRSIPQWHMSIARISSARTRARDHDVQRFLVAFAMQGAEEDNHEPGLARHFWMPVDPTERVDCECKADEVTTIEPDGHRWQAPAELVEDRRAFGDALKRSP
jgi:hypothetical protein